MRKLLALLILLGIVGASAGCIKEGPGGVIISFGNETYTIPINQTTNSSTITPAPTMHTYTKQVQVGEELVIEELNFTIRPDYDPTKGKFFFITSNGVYWEPMNITIGNVTILGKGYFVGTSVYMAEITIESPQLLTIVIKEVSGS